MTDGECGVCLQPLYDPTTVTFSHPSSPDCPVEFCRDCVTALFQFMTGRWKQSIDETNKAVSALVRHFGLEEHFGFKEPRSSFVVSNCPNCGIREARGPYDIGSGPELSCAHCEWCWGADGQDLKPLDPEVVRNDETTDQ